MPNAYCTTGANRRRASGFDLASGRAMEDGRWKMEETLIEMKVPSQPQG